MQEDHHEAEVLETINSANLPLLLVAVFTLVSEEISLPQYEKPVMALPEVTDLQGTTDPPQHLPTPCIFALFLLSYLY